MGILVGIWAVYGIVHDLLDLTRDVAYTAQHAGPVLGALIGVFNFLIGLLTFLTTGTGNLFALVIAVVLILLALRTQPDQVNGSNGAVAQVGATQNTERLRKRLADTERQLTGAQQEAERSERLGEELRHTKEELDLLRAGDRRERIEKWRAEIRAHSFGRHPLGGSWFTQTETYLEMQPRLPPKIRDRFEGRVIAASSLLGPAHFRGTEGDRRILLREVARIEEEWGVI